jgi:hypothetical protein
MKASGWFLKVANWIAWISAGVGLSFLFLGLIQMFYGFILFISGGTRIGGGRLFGDTEIINFFIASSSFFSITIILFLIKLMNQFKKV